MSEENSTAGNHIKPSSMVSEREYYPVDFNVSHDILKGRFPRKFRVFIFLTVVAAFLYLTISSSVIDSMFEDTSRGSAGYNTGMWASIMGMSIAYLIIKSLLDSGSRSQSHDKYVRQTAFAKEFFGPWLEKNGGIKVNASWVAEDLLDGRRVELKEEDNSWGAYGLEFLAIGTKGKDQSLIIWRWF